LFTRENHGSVLEQIVKTKYYHFKGATLLYKPVGGAVANFCTILNMLHITTFFKIKKYLQIV